MCLPKSGLPSFDRRAHPGHRQALQDSDWLVRLMRQYNCKQQGDVDPPVFINMNEANPECASLSSCAMQGAPPPPVCLRWLASLSPSLPPLPSCMPLGLLSLLLPPAQPLRALPTGARVVCRLPARPWGAPTDGLRTISHSALLCAPRQSLAATPPSTALAAPFAATTATRSCHGTNTEPTATSNRSTNIPTCGTMSCPSFRPITPTASVNVGGELADRPALDAIPVSPSHPSLSPLPLTTPLNALQASAWSASSGRSGSWPNQ